MRKSEIMTTTPAAMLPAMTATRAAIMEAAAARHPNTTPDIITLPAFTTTNTAAAHEAARVGHLGAHLALRARHQSSGLQLMLDLDRAQGRDHQREDLPRIAAEALTARAEHIQHRAAAEELDKIAKRISTPAEQAAVAEEAAAEHRSAAARALDHAQRLEAVISSTSHSDRADISQAAALAYWTTGNFTLACSAAGKAIATIAAAQGCTATRTKVMPISADEAAQELAAHPNTSSYNSATGEYLETPCKVPFNVKGGNATTQGFYTIEHRESKRYPAAWYRVNHYYTAAPYISYEVFASDEDAPQLATNGGINIITDEADALDLETLFTRANLSERERLVLRYMMDNTAAAAGIKAVAEHQQQTAARMAAAPNRKAAQRIQRDADKQTESIRAAAQRLNAMTRAGIYSRDNQRKTLQRIRAKLEAAKREQQPPTAEELNERSRRDWERMQSNRSRYTRSSAAAPAPEIMPRITVYADLNAKPTEYANYELVWNENYPQPVTVTEQERRAAEQEQKRKQEAEAAEHRAEILLMEYRRSFTQGRSHSPAFPALDAQAAALVFFSSMSRAEQFALAAQQKAEEAAAAQQKAAEALAKAEAKNEVQKRRSRAAELEALAATAPQHRRADLAQLAEIERRAAERAADLAQLAIADIATRAAQLAADAAILTAAAKA